MFVAVCQADEVPVNTNKAFTVADRSILICNSDDTYFAIDNCCTHQAAVLEGGRIRRGHISCPLHGVLFDLKSGIPKGTLTKKPVKTYPVQEADGTIQVDLD